MIWPRASIRWADGILRGDFVGRPDGDNLVPIDGDCTERNHLARRVHRHDSAAGHQQRHGRRRLATGRDTEQNRCGEGQASGCESQI